MNRIFMQDFRPSLSYYGGKGGMRVFLGVEVSDWINIILLIITFSTVIYARRALFMDHAPQIFVFRYNQRNYRNDKGCSKFRVSAEIDSIGNGRAIKLYMMISDKS